jgi:vanillate O-demethylase ferredoxin subunit
MKDGHLSLRQTAYFGARRVDSQALSSKIMQKSVSRVRVDSIREEAPGIRSFTVSRIDGKPFEPYEPGAHIDVTGPVGITRQYSLCGDPDRCDAHLLAVKRESASRGGSSSLHEHVQVGTELTVGAPRNLFKLDPEAREHVLIAAGIGITPPLSMAFRLLKHDTPFTLHYFARDEHQAAFLPLLSRAPFADHIALHFGVETALLDDALTSCFANVRDGTHAYTCGPGPFMDRVIAIGERYLLADSVHLERFTADPVAAADTSLVTFDVQVASSGKTVSVDKHTSIVAALAAIGVQVDTSCEEGVCGTCMVDVVSGEPDHRDHCLSKTERASNTVICCCVSRSKTPLLVPDI